jgi:tRNA1(Val) A37 N6-methylase TrmN6
MVALARENIGRNGLAARIDVVAVDLTATAASISAAGLREESFAHIVSNPPFYSEGECRPSKDAARARANAMPPGGLERWIRALSRLASSGGGLTLIHRPEGLPELLPLLHGRFGDLKLLPIHPRFDAPAIRIILQGRKGSRAPLKLLPGLVLHDEGNGFRPEIADILSRGASLPLSSRSSH